MLTQIINFMGGKRPLNLPVFLPILSLHNDIIFFKSINPENVNLNVLNFAKYTFRIASFQLNIKISFKVRTDSKIY